MQSIHPTDLTGKYCCEISVVNRAQQRDSKAEWPLAATGHSIAERFSVVAIVSAIASEILAK